ncbi:hypothetical protein GSF70_13940 [Flavobacteriaceae bacterium W22]|nr:hypothetical protein [Flavobacteriaceae bacterium W22]
MKQNAVAGGYKHTCFKPPENVGGLAQLAGNKMQLQEVANSYVYNKIRMQEVTNTLVLKFRRLMEVFLNSKQIK